LSGPVLRVRAGVLRASVHTVPTVIEGNKIVGEIQSSSGPAFYGRIHEAGGSRAYTIMSSKARALKFITHGKTVFAKSVIHPPAMQRSFMASTLAEQSENIQRSRPQNTHNLRFALVI
jgi:hypothetical protein